MQFERLNSASSPAEIASAYREWSAANGGDTSANQAAAQNYLSSLGVNSGTIGTAYQTYQAAPSAPVYHAPIAAPTPAPQPAPVYQAPVAPAPQPAPVYQAPVAPAPAPQPAYASLSRASSPAEIAAVYKQWAAANGGDTAENQRAAEEYLLSLGIHQNVINDAYNTYKAPAQQTTQQGASYATTSVTPPPAYTGLSSTSSPTDIANAYREWSGANGGDTTDNQRAAESYLSSLGLGRDAIYSAYDAYKAPQPLYAGLNNNSNANDIASAYRQWSSANGGDTTDNQRAAESYLQSLGIGSGAINDAYNAYKAPQPLYAGLNNNSSASDIAAAYRQWSSANGGDTTENQRAAESYLQSLGIGSGAINDAYNAYRGPLTTVPATTTPAQNGSAVPGPLTTTAQSEYKMPMLNALYQGQQQRMLSTAPTFNFQQPAGAPQPPQPGSAAGAPQGALTTAISAP